MSHDSTPSGLGDCDSVGEVLSRRRELLAAGVTLSAVGLGGCLGGTGTPTATETPTHDDHGEELPPGVSEDAFEHGPVPDVYQMAVSLGGEERDPDALNTKEDVSFSEYDEALEDAAHQAGQCCANCADFIPDKNADEFGACAEVEGYIDGADWCTIYEELPEPAVPEGMTEDELATAEVPDQYRTATSQGDEERDPDDLQAQADVNLMESVEAIAEGVAQPGQSCGNCADFIPDKNGDTWGACAEVEGYIAVEDWCTLWEHVGEEH